MNKLLVKQNFLIFNLLINGIAHGEGALQDNNFLEAPMIPHRSPADEAIAPEITITEKGGELIYEYRVRGVLYMVRVQPQIGPSYFLYDLNGDGVIDAQDRSPHNTAVPQWVLFQWD